MPKAQDISSQASPRGALDFESLSERFRPPGLRACLVPALMVLSALGLGAALALSPWGLRRPALAGVGAAALGAAAVVLGGLWLRRRAPLFLPTLFGILPALSRLAQAMGISFAAIDGRRHHYLANELAEKGFQHVEAALEGPFERDRRTRVRSTREAPYPVKSDLVRRGMVEPGVVVGHQAWFRPPQGWVHDHTGVVSLAPGVIAVLSVDTSEQEQIRERFVRLQRQLALGEMVAGFVHDANNMLFAGRSALAALDADPEKVREILPVLGSVATQAEEIVSRVSRFANRRLGPRVPTNLNSALEDLRGFAGYLLPSSIALDCVLAEPSPFVALDAAELHHTLLNLVVNARDALGGQGRIVLECGPGAAPGQVRLAVRDNGPGVPEDLRPYIFDPFVTTKNETAGEGTGLGLVMARAFAESANGTLELEDSAEGACFAFTFPACEAPAGEA